MRPAEASKVREPHAGAPVRENHELLRPHASAILRATDVQSTTREAQRQAVERTNVASFEIQQLARPQQGKEANLKQARKQEPSLTTNTHHAKGASTSGNDHRQNKRKRHGGAHPSGPQVLKRPDGGPRFWQMMSEARPNSLAEKKSVLRQTKGPGYWRFADVLHKPKQGGVCETSASHDVASIRQVFSSQVTEEANSSLQKLGAVAAAKARKLRLPPVSAERWHAFRGTSQNLKHYPNHPKLTVTS